MFLAFETGAISKSFHAPLWEVLLNAIIGLLCLGIFLGSLLRKKSNVSFSNSKNGRLVVTFTVLGTFSGITILPYMTGTMGTQMIEQFHLPLVGVLIITVFQVTFMTFIASVIGLRLAEKVQLDIPLLRRWLYDRRISKLSKKWVAVAILGSFIGTFVIVMLETYIFQPRMPLLSSTPSVALWKSSLTIFYGGIVEEVLLRLFLMTLLVWLLAQISKIQDKIPSSIYWIAIVLSSLLFGLGHLPTTVSVFGELTPILFIRAVISNGLMGILFGYLYWKKGLEYAILSHMSADLFLHVIWTSLYFN